MIGHHDCEAFSSEHQYRVENLAQEGSVRTGPLKAGNSKDTQLASL